MVDASPALLCAAFLMGYGGELPDVRYAVGTPSPAICALATSAERDPADAAWLRAAYGDRLKCYAVTWILPDHALTLMPADASWRVQVIEAVRAINGKRRVRMASSAVYAIGDRAGDCGKHEPPERPGPASVHGAKSPTIPRGDRPIN